MPISSSELGAANDPEEFACKDNVGAVEAEHRELQMDLIERGTGDGDIWGAMDDSVAASRVGQVAINDLAIDRHERVETELRGSRVLSTGVKQRGSGRWARRRLGLWMGSTCSRIERVLLHIEWRR